MILFLLVFALLIIGVLFVFKNNQSIDDHAEHLPYYKITNLLTPAEVSFYHVLKIAVSEKYDISIKTRLADLISVQKGIDRSIWGKAFNKIKAKHIDFVLCDKHSSEILCAIELDDESHLQVKRQQRDKFVEKALGIAKLPFARFDVSRTYQSEEIKQQIQLTITPAVITINESDAVFDKVLINPDVEQHDLNTLKEKCPKCSGDLILRNVTKGQNKGNSFYGCSNFPQCRYIKD
tara:strand:- start:2278 stop:2982 length:705 start_codon:yes stop_codon:yes gene_type:complete